MVFPTIPTSGAGRIVSVANTAGGAGGVKTFPDLSTLTKNAGDLLIAICITYDGNSTNAEFSSWGGGFTEFVDQATTATMGIGAAYKVSTGSETGTFTVTTADTSTNDSQMILLSIPGGATAPEGGTITNGTGAAANIAALNPAGWDVEDTLWIAVCGAGEDSTTGSFTAPSAAPTNYGNLFATSVSADVVGGVYGAVAFRQLAAASDDPATFTVDTTQARNSALLIAVRPAHATVTPATIATTVAFPQALAGESFTREFDGAGDVLVTSIGNLANFRDGDMSVAAIIKVNRNNDNLEAGIVEFWDSGPGIRTGLVHGGSNLPVGLQDDGGGAYVGPPPAIAEDVWCVAAITRTSGNIRAHVYNYDTATWTHDGPQTVTGADDTLASVRFAGSGFGADFSGRIAVAAAQTGTAFSDGQIETLETGLQDWVDLFTTGAVWAFNQESTATAVTDLIGSADQTSLTGTTTVLDSPAGFDWDVAAGGATVTPSPIACVTALPQPGVGVGVAPAVAATSVALPAAQTNIGVTPAPIANVAALPQPAISIGVTKAPVAAVAALPQPGVGVGAAPAVIAATTAFPQTAVGVGVTKDPVAAVVALPQAAVGVGVTPATAPLTVAILLPASVGQGASGATVTPDPIATVAALPAAAVGVGAAPAVLAAVTALPQAAVSVGVTPAVIPLTVDMSIYDEIFHERFGAGADIGVGVAPAPIACTVALPLPTSVGQDGGGNATRTPDPIAAIASLPQPGVGVGVTKAPFALTTSLPLATITVHAIAQPATAALVVGFPQARVSIGVVPATIALLVAIWQPERVGPPFANNINPAGPLLVGAITTDVDTLVGATIRRGGMPGGIS